MQLQWLVMVKMHMIHGNGVASSQRTIIQYGPVNHYVENIFDQHRSMRYQNLGAGHIYLLFR